MSDTTGRDGRGRPGIGTTRQPRQPAPQPQPDDGSQSTDSASGTQPPPRPATRPAPRGGNVNTGSSPSSTGFRAATPGSARPPQSSGPLLTRGRAQPQPLQPQPLSQTDDAATSTSLLEDDSDDTGLTPTITTTVAPQPTADGGAKPALTDGAVTRQRTGFRTGPTPGRVANPTPLRARDPAQPRDFSADEAVSDTDLEPKDVDLDTGLMRDPGVEADTSDTSSEDLEEKQPATTAAPSRTTTTPIDAQPPTQSISTTTEAKPTEQDDRRAAFQQQRRVGAKVLAPDKRAWGNDLARVLRLPIPSAQTRLLNEGLATAGQIAGSNAYSPQDQQAASQHEQTLRAAGNPPWGADIAMQAADAKVQLDLLSIPPNNRKLSPLSSDLKSANKTFWIENIDAGGTKTKAFLCKPATDPNADIMPSGGPPGGEVAREALAGRAAQFLLGKGLDIGMPETHVVKLSGGLLPGNAGGGAVTCSVQQFGASVGQLGTQTRAAKGQIDGKKVAALGVFDMMTLANDRHGGNILLGANGELIPIDHGENFSETTNPNAAARLKTTLSGVGNALLAIPSAHDPMPDEVAAAAASVNPGELRATLTADRDAVAAKHGDMKGMISDDAITSAERAGQFTKLAAKWKPRISVAAAQVALGTHVEELLDPTLEYNAFSANAQRILAAVAKQQGAIKEVCLSSNTDYELLCQEVEKLGWRVQRRGEATVPGLVSDPMTMMAILAHQTKIPPQSLRAADYPPELQFPPGVSNSTASPELRKGRRDFQAKMEQVREAGRQVVEQARDSVDDQAANAVLLQTRKQAVAALLPLIPANQQQAMQARAAQLDAGPANAAVAGYRDLSADLTDQALAEQQRRFSLVEQRFRLDLFSKFPDFNGIVVPGAYLDTFNELTAGNVLKGEPSLVTLEQTDLTFAKVRDAIWNRFSSFANQYAIPNNDQDLTAFLGSLQQQDLAVMFGHYKTLRDRMAADAFPKKT